MNYQTVNIFVCEVTGEASTDHVNMAGIHQEIDGRGDYSHEAVILSEFSKLDPGTPEPIAWKWTDPTENGRFVFDESDVAEIAREDPNLLVRVYIVDASRG
ncbi:hypothetical protein [Crateriforma conspicua]|uniref:hypothetical protein n=1 Tax=Crateriforma conspicua TaxID=2527996 RepID=UPI00118AD7C1|nr:hypothetical protein [Crateriforma conspicua]QDV66170.1 hypothetical protein Mal65_53450 [Crateriforma conspicua]